MIKEGDKLNKELFKMEENFKKEEKNRYKMPSLDVISDEVLKKWYLI